MSNAWTIDRWWPGSKSKPSMDDAEHQHLMTSSPAPNDKSVISFGQLAHLSSSLQKEEGDVLPTVDATSSYQNSTTAALPDDDDSFIGTTSRTNTFAKCFAVASILALAVGTSRTKTFKDASMSSEGTLLPSSSTTITNNAEASLVFVPGLVPLYVTKGIPLDPPLSITYPSDPLPFSIHTPSELGLDFHHRSDYSSPGEVFGAWRHHVLPGKQGSTSALRDIKNSKMQQDMNEGGRDKVAMPTNMWYENLLLGTVNVGRVTEHNRAYTIPYIVDFVGPIPGIRVQFPHLLASDRILQMANVPRHGLTLGTVNDGSVDAAYVIDEEYPPTQLGLGLRWSAKKHGGEDDSKFHKQEYDRPTMRTSILRGIPYVTMHYSNGMIPAISAEVPLMGSPIIDNNVHEPTHMKCGTMGEQHEHIPGGTATAKADIDDFSSHLVQNEISLTFKESDFTWLIFFSRPVRVSCFRDDVPAASLPPGVVDNTIKSMFELRVVDEDSHYHPVTVRAALANNCTTGINPLYCIGGRPRTQTHLDDLLRTHSDIYPSNPSIRYEFPSYAHQQKDESRYALIHFDWSPRSMKDPNSDLSQRNGQKADSKELLMYALPHHTDSMVEVVGSTNSKTGYCSEGLHGKACLLRGGEWVMKEDLDGPPSFVAPRPPHHSAIQDLAKAISTDIEFELPKYYMEGAGDTYFSGKMLAKLARILVIASELKGLAATPSCDSFDLDDPSERELKLIVEECQKATLPSEATMTAAVARLRAGVEVWLNGTAQAKFLYDDDWGGIVNCGCLFNGERCDNTYPNCPAFSDPGLNFGNGWYNDHHFHYGYMIYAAAVVANYDLAWGRQHFQEVLMLVRDIANPSVHDKYFPAFRHKDWFLGSSWASGIALIGGQPYPNGRNQESSSEAIHAYEAIALYGAVMVHAWGDGVSSDISENDNAKTASRVREMGRLLTATEIRSAERYWHVLHGDSATNTVYPKEYKPSVVGMMWNTMCQFQTWFGPAPYLAYGIQLMPLTSVSERRDAVKWVQQMYVPFAESCEADKACEEQGWSVLQYAMLAVVGHRDLALHKANGLPPSVFETAGGNGHSRTNTIWYIATRPEVAEPLVLSHSATSSVPQEAAGTEQHAESQQALVCGCPETCNENQQEALAGDYSCASRIHWLMSTFGKTELDACRQVGGLELPKICGGCDPDRCAPPPPPATASKTELEEDKVCPPCSSSVCKGDFNRCPRSLVAPFLCLSGANAGGCAQTPWMAPSDNREFCTNCCRLTERCFGV